MIKSREELKKHIKENMNVESDAEAEFLVEFFIRVMMRRKGIPTPLSSRVIKREQIESGEVEVKPVKWKKLD